MIRLLLPTDESTASRRSRSATARSLVSILLPDPAPGDSAYVIASGDAVWFIVSTVEDVSEIVAALP